MKAVTFSQYGPPEVLDVIECETPRPGPDQLRVRVRAGGIQPFDIGVRRGTMGVPVRFPQPLGNEFAGVVDEVGGSVTGWSPGDEVLGWSFMSSLAEYIVVDTDSVLPKPSDMPWDVAGAMSSSGNTAYTALTDLRIGAGDTLLVHAAAGAAGTVAVQLARAWGASVIGTASVANHAYLESLGATPVAYGPGLVDRVRAVAPAGVDAVLDAVGGQALLDSPELTADPTRIGTLVDHAVAARMGAIGIRGRRSLTHLRELVDLYANGRLRITIRACFPLEQIVDAHREVETGHGRGKVVVVLD